jgi:hypothetical protein
LTRRKHHDYKIRPYATKLNPERQLWQIYIGPESSPELYTTCRSLEEAEKTVAALERDPWALSRGNTQADRAKMSVMPKK